MSIFKPYDNAKLTKLVDRLLNPPELEYKIIVVPDLLHFSLVKDYIMPLPQGKIVSIIVYTELIADVKDANKLELYIDLQFKEDGQLTTKAIPIKDGLITRKLNIDVNCDYLKFIQPSSDVLVSNVTITYLPVKRMEIK